MQGGQPGLDHILAAGQGNGDLGAVEIAGGQAVGVGGTEIVYRKGDRPIFVMSYFPMRYVL